MLAIFLIWLVVAVVLVGGSFLVGFIKFALTKKTSS